jgi:hypothetical protein
LRGTLRFTLALLFRALVGALRGLLLIVLAFRARRLSLLRLL